jgi:nucleotide-binding universal stress UspA family protein
MKILVCTDGSEHSKKTLEEASIIAGGCNADEVAIIHVYNQAPDFSYLREKGSSITSQDIERFREIEEEHKEERKKILTEALKIFEKNNIKANTIFEEGHPAEVIIRVAAEGEFDMIIIGNRGIGGLKRLFLGSVSNAVVQNAKPSVLTVK